MEQKFESFQNHNWGTDQKWQEKLKNAYPAPTGNILSKMKRKHYRDTVDKNFDIDYQPGQSTSQNNTGRQNNTQQDPIGRFANAPDVWPWMRGPQLLLWEIFVIALPFQFQLSLICFLALFSGVIRKFGKIKFEKAWLKQMGLSQDAQMIGLMSAANMGKRTNYVMYTPVILHALLICAANGTKVLGNPWDYLSIGPIRKLFEYIQQPERRQTLLRAKADCEVYVGLYAIIGWGLGLTTLLQVIVYMQVLRVRYILDDKLKRAFTRFDAQVWKFVSRCPSPVVKVYQFIKQAAVAMSCPPAQSMQEQMSGDGSFAQTLGAAFRKCTIF